MRAISSWASMVMRTIDIILTCSILRTLSDGITLGFTDTFWFNRIQLFEFFSQIFGTLHFTASKGRMTPRFSLRTYIFQSCEEWCSLKHWDNARGIECWFYDNRQLSRDDKGSKRKNSACVRVFICFFKSKQIHIFNFWISNNFVRLLTL